MRQLFGVAAREIGAGVEASIAKGLIDGVWALKTGLQGPEKALKRDKNRTWGDGQISHPHPEVEPTSGTQRSSYPSFGARGFTSGNW